MSGSGSLSSPTDSPWLWLSVFLCSALVVLTLAGPKYVERQPLIERQYQARERSGQAVSAAEGPQPLSQPKRLIIPLRPLQSVLAILLVGSAAGFWYDRWRRLQQARRRENG